MYFDDYDEAYEFVSRCYGDDGAYRDWSPLRDFDATPDVWNRIASGFPAYLRAALAVMSTSAEVIDLFSFDPIGGVRMAVAWNASCPSDVLERLSSDVSGSVRAAVADNYNCPSSVFEQLACDQFEPVRFRVALNPNCPVDVLVVLSGDIGRSVCFRAHARL